MKKIIIIFLILISRVSFSQKKIDYVKERNNFNVELINKKYKSTLFKTLNSNEKISGKFLGKLKSKNGKGYYIISNSFIFNNQNSPTAENHIFVYNFNKKCIGYYYLTYTYELPYKISKNKLYFKNSNCKNITIVDFDNGISSAINIICNGEDNYYEFKYTTK